MGGLNLHIEGLKLLNPYLNPNNMQNNGPELIITAIKAIVLHSCGVQVNPKGT